MTRRGDPQRIHEARREAIRSRLISSGKEPDIAERRGDAWEAEAALQNFERGRDY